MCYPAVALSGGRSSGEAVGIDRALIEAHQLTSAMFWSKRLSLEEVMSSCDSSGR